MSEKILCRSEPYLDGKILFSMNGNLFALEKEDLIDCSPDDFFLVKNKGNPQNGLSAPLVVQIQTTNRCNLFCKHCYSTSGVSYDNEMSDDNIRSLLDDLRNWGVLKIQWVGGEVFTRKGFWDFVEYAQFLGFDQSLLTNGVFFGNIKKQEVIKNAWNYFYTIQVSIDDFGDGFDEFVGKKAWSSVCRSIDNLSLHKPKDKTLSVATIIREDNLCSIVDIVNMINGKVNVLRLGKEIVTGRSQKTQEVSVKALFDSWYLIQKLRLRISPLRITHPFDKIAEDADELSLLPFDWKSDNGARTFMYISAEGLAYPFPLLVNVKGFCAGSIFEHDLDYIWNSTPFETYRNVTREKTGCGKCNEPCQIWPRYHFIMGDNLDVNTKPFSHPGCPYFKK